ncbi:unnamed protein product [Pedinophyceae sp. YPF-701]|nr:unnamed protein product [Pedinophyceae sp. YPF-701]
MAAKVAVPPTCGSLARCRVSAAPASRARPVARRAVRAAAAQMDRGASGMDVEGNRPTSPRAWRIMSRTLKAANLQFVSVDKVASMSKGGGTIIDVRPPADYEAGHIPGSVSVPLYQPISGWSVRQIWRRAGFAFFGVFNGTEPNPNFVKDVQEVLSNSKGAAVLVCSQGGTLQETAASVDGKQTRSLMAAYEISLLGKLKQVSVLEGGFAAWAKAGKEIEE